MAPTLPVSRAVAVAVSLTVAGAQAQSLKDMLVLGPSAVIDTIERYRTYASSADVANDFGTTAPEYFAALRWFSQQPQPTRLVVGRWVQTASSGGLRAATLPAVGQVIGTWQAITNGGFRYMKDGGALTAVTGLNFAGAANLNGVAAIIQAALTGVNVVWNAFYQRFEFTSTTIGTASAFAFLQAALAGTDISGAFGALSTSSGAYLFTGQAAETALAALQLMDSIMGQKWYAATILGLTPGANSGADNTALLACAAYLQSTNTKHALCITTPEAGVLVATNTTDIAYQIAAAKYGRAFVQYSSTDAYAAISGLARIMTTDYTGSNTAMTLKFKQEPGVVAESINSSQANALEAKNCNVFVNYENDTAIIEEGVMGDGTYVDVHFGTDWAAIEIQRTLYNLLYTSTTKIPQTDQGMQLLTTGVAAVCSQGVTNGLSAPGVWNAGGFGTLQQGDFLAAGFYIYAQPVNLQNQADRAKRLATPIQVAVKLAGAIHHADVAVTVNQ